jgi:DNA-directed RNA polymerase subunit RPC12/RpoP
MTEEQNEDSDSETARLLANVVCPTCAKQFRLVYGDFAYDEVTLYIAISEGGNVYSVRIRCPHCDYEEEL